MLGKAISIASSAHEGEEDRGGKPYILHPLWVMDRVRHLGEDSMIVGVLHDVVEDTDWTLDKLIKEGFNQNVIHALSLLTHDKSEVPYEKYIEGISKCEIALEVKLRDLEHNSKITRLKGIRDKDFERIKRYHKSYRYLNSIKNKIITEKTLY